MNERKGNDTEGTKTQWLRQESERWTDLFVRVRDGESCLFSVLIDEPGGMLRRRLRADGRTRALANNPADVDDVLQQTFLCLWQRREHFDPARGAIAALSWIIARNEAVNVLRLRSRTVPATARLETAVDLCAAEPDTELLAAEERAILAAALARVANPLIRGALELRLLAGMSYAAVSKATGVPIGTIAQRIHELRRSLLDAA